MVCNFREETGLDSFEYLWVHSKVGITFSLAHMLNTRFKEYYISTNICEIMAFQLAKTEVFPDLQNGNLWFFNFYNEQSFIYPSIIHPSISIYWALVFVLFWALYRHHVWCGNFVSTWLGHRLPRYLVKLYSGCFCEGVLDEIELNW